MCRSSLNRFRPFVTKAPLGPRSVGMKQARQCKLQARTPCGSFVNPKAWAIGKAEVNDNRARWYGQHERSTARLRWRFARTGGGLQRGGQPFDHLKQCVRDAIFKR